LKVSRALGITLLPLTSKTQKRPIRSRPTDMTRAPFVDGEVSLLSNGTRSSRVRIQTVKKFGTESFGIGWNPPGSQATVVDFVVTSNPPDPIILNRLQYEAYKSCVNKRLKNSAFDHKVGICLGAGVGRSNRPAPTKNLYFQRYDAVPRTCLRCSGPRCPPVDNVGVRARQWMKNHPFWLLVSTFLTTLVRRLIPSHIRWRDTLSTASRTCGQA
jgi:hypothetical protein